MSICKYCMHVSEDGTPFCKVCGKALEVIPDLTAQPEEQAPAPGPEAPQNAGSGTPAPHPVQNTPNTFPMNNKDRQAYVENLQNPGRPDNDGICVMALIFGMLSILFNPLLLNSILALILGIVGHACGGPKKDIAKLGWILGLITLVVYVIIGLVFTAMAFGFLWWLIQLFI